jgi:hypothetical protein
MLTTLFNKAPFLNVILFRPTPPTLRPYFETLGEALRIYQLPYLGTANFAGSFQHHAQSNVDNRPSLISQSNVDVNRSVGSASENASAIVRQLKQLGFGSITTGTTDGCVIVAPKPGQLLKIGVDSVGTLAGHVYASSAVESSFCAENLALQEKLVLRHLARDASKDAHKYIPAQFALVTFASDVLMQLPLTAATLPGPALPPGCGDDCQLKSHSVHGNCLLCGKNWDHHNGHTCQSTGDRGSWRLDAISHHKRIVKQQRYSCEVRESNCQSGAHIECQACAKFGKRFMCVACDRTLHSNECGSSEDKDQPRPKSSHKRNFVGHGNYGCESHESGCDEESADAPIHCRICAENGDPAYYCPACDRLAHGNDFPIPDVNLDEDRGEILGELNDKVSDRYPDHVDEIMEALESEPSLSPLLENEALFHDKVSHILKELEPSPLIPVAAVDSASAQPSAAVCTMVPLFASVNADTMMPSATVYVDATQFPETQLPIFLAWASDGVRLFGLVGVDVTKKATNDVSHSDKSVEASNLSSMDCTLHTFTLTDDPQGQRILHLESSTTLSNVLLPRGSALVTSGSKSMLRCVP